MVSVRSAGLEASRRPQDLVFYVIFDPGHLWRCPGYHCDGFDPRYYADLFVISAVQRDMTKRTPQPKQDVVVSPKRNTSCLHAWVMLLTQTQACKLWEQVYFSMILKYTCVDP